MKKFLVMAFAALTAAGGAYASPVQKPHKADTAKVKKYKQRGSTSNIRINGDTTEVRVSKDSIKH